MSEKGKIHRGNFMKLKNCDYSLKKKILKPSQENT